MTGCRESIHFRARTRPPGPDGPWLDLLASTAPFGETPPAALLDDTNVFLPPQPLEEGKHILQLRIARLTQEGPQPQVVAVLALQLPGRVVDHHDALQRKPQALHLFEVL